MPTFWDLPDSVRNQFYVYLLTLHRPSKDSCILETNSQNSHPNNTGTSICGVNSISLVSRQREGLGDAEPEDLDFEEYFGDEGWVPYELLAPESVSDRDTPAASLCDEERDTQSDLPNDPVVLFDINFADFDDIVTQHEFGAQFVSGL
jgi:hypothetical protein